MLDFILDSPFAPPAAAGVAAAIVCAALLTVVRSAIAASVAPCVIFLASYYETYQKVPDFPPAGAANKMFYVAAGAGAFAAALAAFPLNRVSRSAAAFAVSLVVAAWIGLTQFARADAIWFATFAAMVVGGAAALDRLDHPVFTAAGGVCSGATLAACASIYLLAAPIALFGGSSTGVGLLLGASAGTALLSLVAAVSPIGATRVSLLGGGAGLLALVDSLTLISRRGDLIAITLLGIAPFLIPIGLRLLPPRLRDRPVPIWLASGLAALSPLPVILALLFWRHESPL